MNWRARLSGTDFEPSGIAMKRWVERLGGGFLRFISETGRMFLFLGQAVLWMIRPPFRANILMEQFYFITNKSLFIVCLTGAFTGMVFAIQFYFGFAIVNTDAFVGPAAAISLARELSPVFTGIVVTGRAGAAMAAELGTMRVTEQIDAMDVMAVNSIQYLVAPRILVGLFALPILSIFFLFTGNIGSYLAGVYLLGIDSAIYYSHLQDLVEVKDVIQGLIKAAVFGVMFSTIGTYKGYFTQGGAAAVGRSTNQAVVISLVLILVSDYFLTLVIRNFLYGGT